MQGVSTNSNFTGVPADNRYLLGVSHPSFGMQVLLGCRGDIHTPIYDVSAGFQQG